MVSSSSFSSSSSSQLYVVSLTLFVILTFSWQTLVAGSLEDEYNPDYADELVGVSKRHLGSVAAGAGSRGFGFTNSRGVNNPDYADELVGVSKRHLGSVAAGAGSRGFGFTNSRGVNNFFPSNNNNGGSGGSGIFGGEEDADSMKFKRFLGTLARGGWFPRQFRGFVHPGALSYHQKRHIGSVARLGWLPYKTKEENSI